jgi:cation diffusion facilitator CzcD-associated flavoprotein CzcO
MRFVKTSHKITDCRWNEGAKKWYVQDTTVAAKKLTGFRNITVEKTKTGESFEDDADVLISARGNLNEIVWPKIPGFGTFEGEVMHSAAWNQKLVHISRDMGSI